MELSFNLPLSSNFVIFYFLDKCELVILPLFDIIKKKMQLIGFFSWIQLDKLSVRISREIDKD